MAALDIADGFAFGGDYSPEQWDESVWVEDIALMREAGVNLVTVGVFSWGLLETSDGVYDFGWLDRILGMLAEAGIGVDLATPTASPPIWLHRAHPEILPVDRRGLRYFQGGRLQWCPSSPVWRQYATRIARTLAQRYGDHPAVRLWHVSNELGGGNRRCYCEVSGQHFQRWLRTRYGTVDEVNRAWGTAFWGHRYGSFDEIIPPLDSESAQNPGLLLDYDRFSSDALLEHYLAERDALREAGVAAPITTNLMVGPGASVADYASWAPHLDIVANDHYTLAADPHRERELAYSADRTRGLDRSRPWLLMEHSTSAVNWQPRNRAKAPGELIRNSLQHIARGSDGALFFQWRQSSAGAEQFHSAMVPHAGTDSKVWREVVQLGGILRRIGEVAGSLVEPANVAIIADDVAGWAWAAGQKPQHGVDLSRIARGIGDSLYERGVLTDVVPSSAELTGYRLIVVPALFLVSDAAAQVIADAAAAGATVLVTRLSGIVDESNRVRGGGYPGAFRELLGVHVEEFVPLQDGETVTLDSGAVASEWTELLHAPGADVLARYAEGWLAGSPAVTRRSVGDGSAWYLSAGLAGDDLDALVGAVLEAAGVTPSVPVVPGVEAVRRVGRDARYLFLINAGDAAASVPVTGTDLVTGSPVLGSLELPAGAVAVIRED